MTTTTKPSNDANSYPEGTRLYVRGLLGQDGTKIHAGTFIVYTDNRAEHTGLAFYRELYACDGVLENGVAGLYRANAGLICLVDAEDEQEQLDANITCEKCRASLKLRPLHLSSAGAAYLGSLKAAEAEERRLNTIRKRLGEALYSAAASAQWVVKYTEELADPTKRPAYLAAATWRTDEQNAAEVARWELQTRHDVKLRGRDVKMYEKRAAALRAELNGASETITEAGAPHADAVDSTN